MRKEIVMQAKSIKEFTELVKADFNTDIKKRRRVYADIITATYDNKLAPDEHTILEGEAKDKAIAILKLGYKGYKSKILYIKKFAEKTVSKGEAPYSDAQKLRFYATADNCLANMKQELPKGIRASGPLDRMQIAIFDQSKESMKKRRIKPYPLNKISRK